jgi:hypothetical protein
MATSTSSTAMCDLQIAQRAQFVQKTKMKLIFKNKKLFYFSLKKGAHKHVDEIDTWW